MSKEKIFDPYQTGNTKKVEESHSDNIPYKMDDVILPKSAKKRDKTKILVNIVLDGTYSMEKIYSFVYNHLCKETENLKKLDAEVSIQTIVVHDNDSQNMGEYGTIDKFKQDLLAVKMYGGSEDGYEPYLNNALAQTAAELQEEENADIRCIMLITDSMPGGSPKPKIKFDENVCNLVLLLIDEPENSQEFMYMENTIVKDIRSFLMSSDDKLLYTEIEKIMEKKI